MKHILSEELASVVKYFYCYERENFIELNNIVIEEDSRFSGYGRAVMEVLCKYADGVQKPILCSPESSDSRVSDSKLISFYESLGFELNRGKHRDYSMPSHSYKRMPNI